MTELSIEAAVPVNEAVVRKVAIQEFSNDIVTDNVETMVCT
jgi:hypothetical protein